MILAVDIGNSNIVLGCFENDQILFIERLSTNQNSTELEYTILIKNILELNNLSHRAFAVSYTHLPFNDASFSRKSGSPALESPITAMIPPMNAKLEPRKTGTFRFVTRWNRSVPSPAQISVIEVFSPVSAGTSTVAPNMARTC